MDSLRTYINDPLKLCSPACWLKGYSSVISCKDGNVRLTTVPLKIFVSSIIMWKIWSFF